MPKYFGPFNSRKNEFSIRCRCFDTFSPTKMSTASYKLKIVFAGPCKTGKTSIANFLADATEVSGSESDYWPTHVVRILEFEQVYISTYYLVFLSYCQSKCVIAAVLLCL